MEPGEASILTQLRRGVIEHGVLALVAGEPKYGLDIARTLHDAGLLESEGTLYPVLSRLRKRELVTTTWAESPSGPPRRYYALTPSGRQALTNFRAEWILFRDSVDSVIGATS
ncbi:PadR family transcriptional regulator [Kribbella sp. NPDC056861]|uniref:PadR family transcriptional regulator n=1 Tax=Kribbella sp. NPDC056861 TaxID=3154857 RepID=UPI003419266A